MESFVDSDIARLVYGYLLEHKCNQAAQSFLECSKLLEECREITKKGRRFYTKIAGRTLSELLDLFSEIVYQLSSFFADSSEQTNLTPLQVLFKLARLLGFTEAVINQKLFDPAPVINSNICLLDGTEPVRTNDGNTEASTPIRQPSSAEKRKSYLPHTSPREGHLLTQEDLFDLNVLDTLINNTVLHEKIAANINKAKESDTAKGEDSGIVKAALSNTEADPIFDQVIKDIVASAPAENVDSSTPEDTEAENAEEGSKNEAAVKTDEEKRLEAENEAVDGILSSGKEVRRLSEEATEPSDDPPIEVQNDTPNDVVAESSTTVCALVPQNDLINSNQLNPIVGMPIIIQVIPPPVESNLGTTQSSFLNFHGLMQTAGKNETSYTEEECNRYRPILPKNGEDEEEPQNSPLCISPIKIPGNRKGVKMRGGKRRRVSKRNLKALCPVVERINQDNYHIDLAVPPNVTLRSLRPRRGRPLKHISHEMIHADLLKRAQIRYEEVITQENNNETSPDDPDKCSAEPTVFSQNENVQSETSDISQTIKDILNCSGATENTPEKKISEIIITASEEKILLESNKVDDESNDSSYLEETGLVIEETEEQKKENLSGPFEKGSTEEGSQVTEEINRTAEGNPDGFDQSHITSSAPTKCSEMIQPNSAQDTEPCLPEMSISESTLEKGKPLNEGKNCQKKSSGLTTSQTKTPCTISRALPLRKGLSLSSPRRGSHVRALDFKTPDKSNSSRKAATSPKAVSQVNLTKLRSMRRVSLFKTPIKKKSNSSWDADLRAYCPITNDIATNRKKSAGKQIRKKNSRKMTKPRKTMPMARKRAMALHEVSEEAERTVLAAIQEENDERNDIVQKIFKEADTVADKSDPPDNFSRPKSPGPGLLHKTPAKPTLAGDAHKSLTPSHLMTPVTKILKEHSKLLAANQLLTPSFAATPDFAKDNIYDVRDERTPSPQPAEDHTNKDACTSEISGSFEKRDEMNNTLIEEDKSLNHEDEEQSIDSPNQRKLKSRFPKVGFTEPKITSKKESTKENLIEKYIELAKNELFPSPGPKKRKTKAKTKKSLKIPESPEMMEQSIELPSFDEMMERYKQISSKSSSSSNSEDQQTKGTSFKGCLSKYTNIFDNSCSSSEDEQFSSSIASPIKSSKGIQENQVQQSGKLKSKRTPKKAEAVGIRRKEPVVQKSTRNKNISKLPSILAQLSDSSSEDDFWPEANFKKAVNQCSKVPDSPLKVVQDPLKNKSSPKKSPLAKKKPNTSSKASPSQKCSTEPKSVITGDPLRNELRTPDETIPPSLSTTTKKSLRRKNPPKESPTAKTKNNTRLKQAAVKRDTPSFEYSNELVPDVQEPPPKELKSPEECSSPSPTPAERKSLRKKSSPKKSPLTKQSINTVEQRLRKKNDPGLENSDNPDFSVKEPLSKELKSPEETIAPDPASLEEENNKFCGLSSPTLPEENNKSFVPSRGSIQAPSLTSLELDSSKSLIHSDRRNTETVVLESPASPEPVSIYKLDSVRKDNIKKSSVVYSESKGRKKDDSKYHFEGRYHYPERKDREAASRYEERRYIEARRYDSEKKRKCLSSYGREPIGRRGREWNFKRGHTRSDYYGRSPYSRYSPSKRSPHRYRSPDRYSPEPLSSSKKSAHKSQRHSSPTTPRKQCLSPKNISPIYTSGHSLHHSRNSDTKDHKSKKFSHSPSLEKLSDNSHMQSPKVCTPVTIPTNPRDVTTDPRLIDPRLSDPRKSATCSIYKNLTFAQKSVLSSSGSSNKRKLNLGEKEDGEISDSDTSSTFYLKKQKIDLQSSNSCDINTSFTSVDQVTSEKGKSLLEKVGVDRFLSILHGSP